MVVRLALVLVLAALTLSAGAEAQVKGYRWVDDDGTVHYASRRDQVPERYRSQLKPPKPGDPPAPRLAPAVTGRASVPTGCILRLRGTERARGSSYSFATCDACRKALRGLSREDARRGECYASAIEDELGKGRR
jgi:Domain of unknown function (DUF4124)